MQNRPVNRYFNFTRKERNGTILLLCIILLLTFIPILYPFLAKEKKQIIPASFKDELAAIKSKANEHQRPYKSAQYDDFDGTVSYNKNTSSPAAGTLFNFDPNTLSVEGWKKLGLHDKAIHTIQNYLSKGGKFRKPEDIGKIWGLNENMVKRLLPYVDIKEKFTVPDKYEKGYAISPANRKTETVMVDINDSDTSDWKALPGIGSKLALRIVNFRSKLGGFYSISQVAETFGLPDSVYQKIKPGLTIGNIIVKKININTATLEELKQHPYIRYNLAGLIVQYRNQHGSFSKIEDLGNIMAVTSDVMQKLSAYITIQ